MLDFLSLSECKYLNLTNHVSVGGSGLLLTIEEFPPKGSLQPVITSNAQTISATTDSLANDDKSFVLFFSQYVSYEITNESYSMSHIDYQIGTGKYPAQLLEKSHYLDYIKQTTHADALCNERLVHYLIGCCDHIVSVVTEENIRPTILLTASGLTIEEVIEKHFSY